MNTPWGPSQQTEIIAPGIKQVSTASHGGVFLEAHLNEQVPDYMRIESGWYEEDCEWSITAVVFEKEWRAYAEAKRLISGDNLMECAFNTLKHWYPDLYERFAGQKLQPGESTTRDQAVLMQKHAGDFTVSSAWGDWHKDVPLGSVGIYARRASDGAEKYFLVPKEDYDEERWAQYGCASIFVVDLSKHVECAPIY